MTTQHKNYRNMMNDLKTGIKKMYEITMENLDMIAEYFQDSTDEESEQVLSKIKTNDLALRSLGDSLELATVRIIGLQAPLSTDLRMVISSFRMIYDLERASRDSLNAFNSILDIEQNNSEYFHKETDLIGQSVGHAKQMMQMFIDIYMRNLREGQDYDYRTDVDKATELDNKIDEFFNDRSQEILNRAKNSQMDPANAVNYLSAIRSIERVGDHCANLIERAIYILTGDKVIVK